VSLSSSGIFIDYLMKLFLDRMKIFSNSIVLYIVLVNVFVMYFVFDSFNGRINYENYVFIFLKKNTIKSTIITGTE